MKMCMKALNEWWPLVFYYKNGGIWQELKCWIFHLFKANGWPWNSLSNWWGANTYCMHHSDSFFQGVCVCVCPLSFLLLTTVMMSPKCLTVCALTAWLLRFPHFKNGIPSTPFLFCFTQILIYLPCGTFTQSFIPKESPLLLRHLVLPLAQITSFSIIVILCALLWSQITIFLIRT